MLCAMVRWARWAAVPRWMFPGRAHCGQREAAGGAGGSTLASRPAATTLPRCSASHMCAVPAGVGRVPLFCGLCGHYDALHLLPAARQVLRSCGAAAAHPTRRLRWCHRAGSQCAAACRPGSLPSQGPCVRSVVWVQPCPAAAHPSRAARCPPLQRQRASQSRKCGCRAGSCWFGLCQGGAGTRAHAG